MKKLVISGSARLYERALYWRGYFEGRGYEVIDWTRPIFEGEDFLAEERPAPGLPLGKILRPTDATYADELTKCFQQFYKHLDQTDSLFLMNEDQNGIEGYIGPNAFAELMYAITGNLNRGRKVDIQILKMPSKEQRCYEDVKFWLDQDLLKIYRRPTGKKATVPVPDDAAKAGEPIAKLPSGEVPATAAAQPTAARKMAEGEIVENPAPQKSGFFGRGDKMLDITTCNKKCLKSLTPEAREYLKVLSPEFPAWLLKYIAAPEMQRLINIGMACGLDYTSLYTYRKFYSVFEHSIGVAFIVWHFTHDKKQTLAGLFHDIATPAFKHSIDFMNHDAETQESTEDKTAEIIRNSRVITKQLKRDNILPSEVSDYHIYPIADNPVPQLSADRLEYTLANGYYLYDIWNFEQIKTFYNDITVLQNEENTDELGFQTLQIAQDFTTENLPLAAIYHGEKSRANMQFLADVVSTMINSGYLTAEDLYIMSEREIVDWILSCGDKLISDAFRQYQRATTVYAGGISKKNCYCTSVKAKIRYIVPLVAPQPSDEERSEDEEEPTAMRVTKLSNKVNRAVKAYLDEKQSKYVGFDFDFKPYTTEQ